MYDLPPGKGVFHGISYKMIQNGKILHYNKKNDWFELEASCQGGESNSILTCPGRGTCLSKLELREGDRYLIFFQIDGLSNLRGRTPRDIR